MPIWRKQGAPRYYEPSEASYKEKAWTTGDIENIQDEEDLCLHPEEHRAQVVDPGVIVDLNKIRVKQDPTRPAVRFYAFVQHEGDIVVTKRHNPHLVVSIGQTFGVARNFVEPQHVYDLWDKDEGVKHCTCPAGFSGENKTPAELSLQLRDVEIKQTRQKRRKPEA